jgi:hypothetical protein
LGAVVFFLIVFMYSPTVSSITNTLPWNLGDPALTTWILSWESHALVAEPLGFFQGNMFFPYGDAIKYSDPILPVLPVFGLVLWATGNAVLAYNMVTLGLAAFSLIATFQLASRLVGRRAALVAAVSFSFSGYVFMHQSHIQLLTIGFFPLAFLALFRALERRRSIDGVWLGVATALLTTSSLYYGAIWFVCFGVIVLTDLIRRRRPDRSWWISLLSAALVIAILIGPIAYVYASFQADVPLAREVGGLGLNPIDFLTPAPGSLVYDGLSGWASARQPTGVVEHGFFVGFTVMGLALVALVLIALDLAKRADRRPATGVGYEIGLLIAAGAVSVVLAIGPEALGITFPFHYLSTWIPGYDAIRAASRLAVPGLLAISILAAWSLKRMLIRTTNEQSLVVVALVTSVILVEMWVTPLRVDVDPPDAVRAVLSNAEEGAVVELPMRTIGDPEFAFVEGPRLLAAIGDWRPRFNGYSGGFPPGYLDDVQTMTRFPQNAAIDRMRELGLRYVILHGDEHPSDRAYSQDQIRAIISSLPAGVVVTKAEADWLVDLGR